MPPTEIDGVPGDGLPDRQIRRQGGLGRGTPVMVDPRWSEV